MIVRAWESGAERYGMVCMAGVEPLLISHRKRIPNLNLKLFQFRGPAKHTRIPYSAVLSLVFYDSSPIRLATGRSLRVRVRVRVPSAKMRLSGCHRLFLCCWSSYPPPTAHT